MNKCDLCGSEYVWVGDMLTGELGCKCGPQPTVEEIDANIKSLNGITVLREEEEGNWLTERNMDMTARRSGRTHDMVLRALTEAGKGNMVVILTTDCKMVRYIENMIFRLGIERRGHQFVVPCAYRMNYDPLYGSVRVLSVHADPRGANRSARVFADHALRGRLDWTTQDHFNHWRARYEIMS